MQHLSIGFLGLLVLKAPHGDTGCTGIMSCQKLVSQTDCPSVARHSSVATAATSSSAMQALSEMLLQQPELMLACWGDLWLSRKAQHLASGLQPSSRQHRGHPRENLLLPGMSPSLSIPWHWGQSLCRHSRPTSCLETWIWERTGTICYREANKNKLQALPWKTCWPGLKVNWIDWVDGRIFLQMIYFSAKQNTWSFQN